MDLNPWEFKSPYEAFEFGNYCLKQDVDLVCLLANWLYNSSNKNEKNHVLEVNSYWADRLTPIVESNSAKKVYFCVANRIGTERNTRFTGSSCILRLKPPAILANTGLNNEEIIVQNLIWTV